MIAAFSKGKNRSGSANETRPATSKLNQNALLDAIGRSQALIEFQLDGTIISANENFLKTLGYDSVEEVKGKKHGIFVDDAYRRSPEYEHFWDVLRNGHFHLGLFKRICKDGKEVWLQASYNPVFDANGKPVGVVKNAVDVTEETLKKVAMDAENEQLVATLNAIGNSQALIEFEMDGTIITANRNFLDALNYGQLDEVKGKHHSIFVDGDYRQSPAYEKFWQDLRSGQFQAGVFKRISKDGKEIWLQAAYNPVLDADGNPYKVIKNAVDITAEKTGQQSLASNMKDNVENVASSSREMRSAAQSMAASAEETKKLSMVVASASEQASQNVQTVASAAEELASSIAEISRQVTYSNEISKRAEEQTKQTNETVQGLAEAAQKIGDVVNLINDIAAQTNLLALNATIEAARAGEAGKGFAVVASEVKNLANQTAKATEEIAGQITAMQTVTTDAVSAIDVTTKTISEISEIASTISAAVEEQGAATREISQNVTQAATGTTEVSDNIASVNQAASESGSSASNVLEAANSLAEEGDRMREEVESFLRMIG